MVHGTELRAIHPDPQGYRENETDPDPGLGL